MNYIKDKMFKTDIKNPYKQNASLFHEILGEYVRRELTYLDGEQCSENEIKKQAADFWNNLPGDEARLKQLALWSCVGIHLNNVSGSTAAINIGAKHTISLDWAVFRDGKEFEEGLYNFLDADALKRDSFIIDMVDNGKLSFRASIEFLQRPKLLSLVEDEYMLFKKPLADVEGRVDLFWIALKKRKEYND